MHFRSAAAALMAATAFTQLAVGELLVVTNTITETATSPLGGICQNTHLPQEAAEPSPEFGIATSVQATEEMVVAPSTSTTWTTTTTTIGLTTFTSTLNTLVARSAVMSLQCGCKINSKNGFIACPSEDKMPLDSDAIPACATSKTFARIEHVTHTDAGAHSSTTTRQPGVSQPTKQRRTRLEARDNSVSFIDQCSYQPRTPFTITSTPVDTSAPVYDFQFNPSILGKSGPFTIDDNGQLFDATGRMATFDPSSKFRLRSPVAFTYPSPATWSACGEGNTLLFGTSSEFYQCGNVSFPAVWNTVPPGYTAVSAQEGYSTTTCIEVKLVWSQVSEAELRKRQDGVYPTETPWPVTCGLLPGCTMPPTLLAKRGLHEGVEGDSVQGMVYNSPTARLQKHQDDGAKHLSIETPRNAITAKAPVVPQIPFRTPPPGLQGREVEHAPASPEAATPTSAPQLEPRQNSNPCQMQHGCGTAYTTEVISWAAANTVIGDLTISHEAGTTTVVLYDNPKPGDGPPPDMERKRHVLELHATYTTEPSEDSKATATATASATSPHTGDSSKMIDRNGSKAKQLIAATIGMAFFAVLAFML